MSDIIEPRTLKGFRDYGPQEQLARQWMFAQIQTVFERFGFLPLSTPALEYKEILMGKYGDEERLVYSFKDNGDRDVALRYDLTVPLARYVAQNQGGLLYPFKRYQIAPVWRAENTQKGRLREFYQCDVDVVGTDAVLVDAEVIACMAMVLEALGVFEYEIRVNDRALLDAVYAAAGLDASEFVLVTRALDKLDKISALEAAENFESAGGSSLSGDFIRNYKQAIGEGALAIRNIQQKFPNASTERVEQLLELITQAGVHPEKLIFDPRIVRGLDYYSSTVFEIKLKHAREEVGSIAGGGRYDGLIDTFSTKPLSAMGGSLGVDRLYAYLESTGQLRQGLGAAVVALNVSERTQQRLAQVAAALRRSGVAVDMYYDTAKLDKQFKYAESKGARYALLLGEAEVAQGSVIVKDLAARTQEAVAERNLAEYVKAKVA